MSKLTLDFLGLHLANPLMTASGCFGYGTDYANFFDPNILGAAVLKGLTLEPRDGNAGVRIAETPSGMLNCVGLENVGYDEFVRRVLPEILPQLHIPLIININGKTAEEYAELAARLNGIAEVAAVELNISCPNVKHGGMAFGTDPAQTERVVSLVRAASRKPLIVKLSPNVTDITVFARIAEAQGADALSLINTVSGMAIDITTQKPLLGNIFGGLSGPAVKPIAVRMVYQVSQVTSLPIVGMGGIRTAEDAIEFILAGASAVAVGCGLFNNPCAAVEILDGLERYCERHQTAVTDLVGRSHPDGGAAYRSRLKRRGTVRNTVQ